MKSLDSIEFRRAEIDIGGGKLWLSAFAVNPKYINVETTVFARELQLERWLPIVSRGRARGRGQLSGQMGVRLQWKPVMRVKLERGYLHSDGKGRFAATDRTWLRAALQRHTANMALGSNQSDLIKDRVVGALSDFQYDNLRARIVERGADSVVSISLRGRGRLIPQELDLTLNVGGYEAVINPVLRAWLANEDAKE